MGNSLHVALPYHIFHIHLVYGAYCMVYTYDTWLVGRYWMYLSHLITMAKSNDKLKHMDLQKRQRIANSEAINNKSLIQCPSLDFWNLDGTLGKYVINYNRFEWNVLTSILSHVCTYHELSIENRFPAFQ